MERRKVGLSTLDGCATGPVMATKQQAASLREKAAKCRRLANGMADDETIAALLRLADSYERQASEIEALDPD